MTEQRLQSTIDTLRQNILAGEYGRHKMPPRTDLAKEFGTTRSTINAAIQQLQAEGLILYSKGSRLPINPPKQRLPGVVESFDRYLKAQGLTPKFENLEAPTRVTVAGDLAASFGVPEGTEMVRRRRLQGTTATPYRLAETYYLGELLDDEMYRQLREDSYFVCIDALYERYGKYIEDVHEEVIVRFPDASEQQLLHIIRNAPVIQIHRHSRSSDGTLLMASRIIFVGSYFVFDYTYHTDTWKIKYQDK
jgi:DNA-binding GntR family transcriptional regulator